MALARKLAMESICDGAIGDTDLFSSVEIPERSYIASDARIQAGEEYFRNSP